MEEVSFSAELRTRSRRQHSTSDALVKLLAPLILSHPHLYRRLLLSWYYIFKAIEEELDSRRRQYPKVSPLYFRELMRTNAFEEDLRYYYGNETLEQPSQATSEYIQKFKEYVEHDPIILIAFCQTMHMATFSGGRILRVWLRRAFRLPEGVGTSAFEFNAIPDRAQFRTRYEEAIDGIALNREEKDRIIHFKRLIFQMNDQIFAEIQANSSFKYRLCLFMGTILAGLIICALILWFLRKRLPFPFLSFRA